MTSNDAQRPPDGNGPEVVAFWKDELARYEEEFKPWHQRVAKIIRRYRDERPIFQNASATVKYAVLWSNIQTLGPAIYSRAPQPIVERRYLDKDFLANVASQALQRVIETNLEVGYFDETMLRIRLDYLLCGRGQAWVRYEPDYEDAVAPITQTEDYEEEPEAGPGDVESEGDEAEQPDQVVAWEKVCIDYVNWPDFAHTAARTWPEVWWVAKRAWLTREEGIKRFGKDFAKIQLKKPSDKDVDIAFGKKDRAPKAEVWEIWDKVAREVTFFAPDLPEMVLERVPDPLRLKNFYPCPEPLYATTTNDTLVPIPDYAEYQDQAEEIDSLTGRISKISAALKVVGLYDGSIPQLARILQANTDNTMIAVDSWAAFAEKGGVAGSVSWMPIKDLAQVLMQLYEAREAAKRDLFEITGMSDIIRGQSSGAAKTATEQRIKGQFASMRLEDRRKAVARFARDIVAIVGEIAAEHFSPETMVQMSGMLPNVERQLPDPAPAPQGLPAPSPVSVAGQAGPAQGPPPPNPQMIQMQKQQMAMEIMGQALMLLKDDKMRTFRIDIETDSTVEADAAEEKESVIEFMGAMSQFLTASLPLGQMAPPLVKPLAESFLFAARRFKMGRSVETSFEQALEKLEQLANQPQQAQADPKAAAEKQKAESDVQIAMIKAQAEMAKQQMQSQLDQQEMAFKAQKQQFEAEKLAMEMDLARMKFEQSKRQAMMDAMMPGSAAA